MQGQSGAGRLRQSWREDGEAKIEQLVKIEAGQVYKPVFVLNAGTADHPSAAERGRGCRRWRGRRHRLSRAARCPSTYYGDTKVVLPAGDQKVTVKIGEGEVTETIPLAAGQTVEKDIIVGVGHIVANAYYIAGGDKVDGSGIGFQVVKAKKKIDGSRRGCGLRPMARTASTTCRPATMC